MLPNILIYLTLTHPRASRTITCLFLVIWIIEINITTNSPSVDDCQILSYNLSRALECWHGAPKLSSTYPDPRALISSITVQTDHYGADCATHCDHKTHRSDMLIVCINAHGTNIPCHSWLTQCHIEVDANGHNFVDDIFKFVFLYGNCCVDSNFMSNKTIHYWLKKWLGPEQLTNDYLKQWWLIYWHLYASFSLDELMLGNHKYREWNITKCA